MKFCITSLSQAHTFFKAHKDNNDIVFCPKEAINEGIYTVSPRNNFSNCPSIKSNGNEKKKALVNKTSLKILIHGLITLIKYISKKNLSKVSMESDLGTKLANPNWACLLRRNPFRLPVTCQPLPLT